MDYGICRLCGEDRLLLRASHLIPSSLYRHMKPGAALFGVLAPAAGVSQKGQSLSGHTLMDTCTPIEPVVADLFCGPCDNDIFGALDFYAHHVLAERLPGARHEGAAQIIEPVHYGRLKLFLWSIFWRAAVSGDQRFAALSDLPLEELRRRLLAADPGEPDFLPVAVLVHDGPDANWPARLPPDAVAIVAGRYAFVWGGPPTLTRDRLVVTSL